MNLMNIRSKSGLSLFKKGKSKINMNKTDLAIVICVLGLLFGAFMLDIWSAKQVLKRF